MMKLRMPKMPKMSAQNLMMAAAAVLVVMLLREPVMKALEPAPKPEEKPAAPKPMPGMNM